MSKQKEGQSVASKTLGQPLSAAENTALAELVRGQGNALAQTQEAQRQQEHAGLDGLARLGAVLRTVDAACSQALQNAATD